MELAHSLGAAATLDIADQSTLLTVRLQHYFGTPPSCIIEASGSAAALETALQVLARKGQMLLIGDYGRSRAKFTWNTLVHREIELMGSNASAGAWAEAVQLALKNKQSLSRLITHVVPVEQFEEAFALVRRQQSDVTKTVLEW